MSIEVKVVGDKVTYNISYSVKMLIHKLNQSFEKLTLLRIKGRQSMYILVG